MPKLTAKPLLPQDISRQTAKWLWDSVVPGLGVLLDGRRHVYVYKGRDSTRKVLGSTQELTLDQARAAALTRAAGMSTSSKKPGPSRKVPTVAQLAQRYLDNRKSLLKPKTIHTYEQCIRLWLGALGSMRVSEISKEVLIDWYSKSKPASALKTLRLLRAAAAELSTEHPEILAKNPFAGFARRKIAPASVPPAETVIPAAMLSSWWKRVEKLRSRPRAFLKFLLLTGFRLDQARLLKWDQVDFESGVVWLLAEQTKNNQRIEFPLGTHSLELLRGLAENNSQYVFHGRRKTEPYSGGREAFNQVSAAIGLHHSAHDLRRTRATIAQAQLRVSTIMLKRLMTHKLDAAPTDSITTGGYARTDADDLRPWQNALENEILYLAGILNRELPMEEPVEFWANGRELGPLGITGS